MGKKFENRNEYRGILNPNNKYTEEQIHQVCKMLEEGKPISEISKITKVFKSVCYPIKNRKVWKHISVHYKF